MAPLKTIATFYHEFAFPTTKYSVFSGITTRLYHTYPTQLYATAPNFPHSDALKKERTIFSCDGCDFGRSFFSTSRPCAALCAKSSE